MDTLNSSSTDPLATPTDGPADSLGPYDGFQAMVRGPAAKLDSDLEMIVNVTREYPFDYATVMFGYIMPFVLVLTLITNTLVVMVLAQRHMRTPTNIVLFTMAIVDLMTLLSPSPWYFYIYTLGYHDKFLYPPVACYAHYYMTDVIPVFFHTSSIWLALLLAGQRYIYVCHPSLASTWCTVPRVRKAILVILVIAFLHQITRFFDNKFEAVSIQFNQLQHRACRNEVSEWVQSIDIGVYYITYYTFRIVFVFIIPCVALITLNCLLFRALRRAENKRSELLKTKFKFVGGTRSSVAGYEPPPSSYAGPVIKNECSATPRPSSNPRWPSRRKISSPLVRLSRNTTDADAEDVEQEQSAPNIPRRGLSVSAAPPTSASSPHDRTLATRAANEKASNKSANSKTATSDKTVGARSDSNESESLLGERRDSRRSSKRGSFAGSRCGMREQHKQQSKESNESYSLVSNQSNTRDENQSKSKISDDDDEPCPGCAYCEQQQHQQQHQLDDFRCRRCLTSSTSTANHCPQHHQPVSQCSSLAGGATNTTTNDEVSSCGNTHNISSSLYVVHDNTMDGIEGGSIKEEQGELLEGERESSSLCQNNTNSNNDKDRRAKRNRKSVSADGATRPDSELTKSNSIDSRLICGCPMSPQRRAGYRCARLSSTRADTCRECCLANRCARQQTRSRPSANQQLARPGAASMQKCVASCSSSDPCIKCSNQPQENSSCKSAAGRESTEPTTSDKRKPISQSSPDYYADKCAVDASDHPPSGQRSNADIYLDGNAAATTTTTTTLYSIQANSVGSLLQAQAQAHAPGQSQLPNQSRQRSLCTPQLGLGSGLGQDTRAKSPSFVSTMGRGSRATLVGNSTSYPNPPTLVVTSGNYPVASLRTMDSNRTTLMLIVVVTVFLMVEVPVAIVTISHVILNSFEAFKDVEFSAYLNYIKLFTNFFIMISYSVNFTIYCSMSKKFRETFRDLFLCGRQARRKRAGLLYQQNQHSQYINNNTNTNNNNTASHNVNANNTAHSYSPCPNLLLERHEDQDRAKSCASNEPTLAPANQSGDQPAEQRTPATAKRFAPAYKTTGAEGRQEECEL